MAQRNAERLLALVSDLLMSANSAVHVHPRRTDLASLVEASLGSAQAHAQASRVCALHGPPAPLWAHVDPLRIGQALDNLVSNAIKYSPDGGTVRVSASTGGGRVLLHVEDDGMGMTAADAERVFTRFFRSPAVREGSIPGAGLGLSITKAIVERHGGSISCSTRPGRGSTFTVELPAEAARRPSRPPGPAAVGHCAPALLAQGPGQLGPGQQPAGRRVGHFLQHQRMRGGQHGLGVPLPGEQPLVQPAGRLDALPHVQRRAHQGADHVVAERIGLDGGHDDAVGAAGKLEALQFPDGGGAFPRLAVGPEILQSQQLGRRLR